MDTPRQHPSGRIEAIDLARGAALVAMAIYHFAWDLEFFGYVEPGMTAMGGWKYFARCIASSFLFLVGVSLYLAHARGVRWQGFWRRLAMVVVAAGAITLATYFATPDSFIFFGILHQIAFASVVGLIFLRLPSLLVLLAAAAVIAAPHVLRSAVFDPPLWWWTGLSENPPRSSDYVPVFPWLGAVLTGIGIAGIAQRAGAFERLAALPMPRWSGPLRLAGRHSLLVYLVHQPILIGGLFLFSQVLPPTPEAPATSFVKACERSCLEQRDGAFCVRYCACVLGAIEDQNMLDAVFAGDHNEEMQQRLSGMVAQCTAETDRELSGGK